MTLIPRLSALNPDSLVLSKRARSDMWASFCAGGSTHSAYASTLWYLIERCEREGIPYRLEAYPGRGYFIKHLESLA